MWEDQIMKEDFVSFEIAKKLKEKGFEQGYNIFGYKLIFSDENTIKYISDIGAYENEYFGINIPCPSISQALKWLREKKAMHIVCPFCEGNGFYFYVQEFGFGFWHNTIMDSSDYYATFEKAALAGIKYVIDNLI